MRAGIWGAALFAALAFCTVAAAQDVTLTARDGSLRLDGSLQGFDGEFYRVETIYGLLTVDGAGVICTGPGCPDLTAPLAVIRILGASDAGIGILPPVLAAFARSRGVQLATQLADDGFQTELSDPATGQTLARISFAATAPEAARAALDAGRAELVVAALAEGASGARVLALDALIPIVAADNDFPRISTADLARALTGEVVNWQELGGPDMPIVLHALAADSALQQALAAAPVTQLPR